MGAARRARPAGQGGDGRGDHRGRQSRRPGQRGGIRTAAHDLRRAALPAAADTGAADALSRFAEGRSDADGAATEDGGTA
ncbi:hypothetical protein LUTEI9C_10312 [Luteimonas sp. 9C]|nr:hypothetical protein LUTEI9C_10312 [Luteimonas sp. 9C]